LAATTPRRGAAAASSERLILRAFALVRVATLLQGAVAAAIAWDHFRHPLGTVAILLAVTVESVVVVEVSRRRGALDSPRLVALDLATGMAAITAINLLLKRSADPYWDDFLYPYTVASMSIVGLAVRPLAGVVLLPLLMAGAYVASTVAHFGFEVTVLENSTTYWAFSLIAWGLSRRYRRLSAQLDQARQEAVSREVELARERERARHGRELQQAQMAAVRAELELERARARDYRDLHDHVLQTLEIMGRDGWVSDRRAREHIAQEAAWLRRLIEGTLARRGGDLVGVLAEVVEHHAAAGLQVDLNAAGMGQQAVGEEVAGALAGAVNEALTNVRKHAGVSRAVVRAVRGDDGVTVTVLDQGGGFDPRTVRQGVGIPHSLLGRMRQVRGTARIDSAPGAGTYVELWAPAGRPCPQNQGHADPPAPDEDEPGPPDAGRP
jgi:signal transduction histidine kinase